MPQRELGNKLSRPQVKMRSTLLTNFTYANVKQAFLSIVKTSDDGRRKFRRVSNSEPVMRAGLSDERGKISSSVRYEAWIQEIFCSHYAKTGKRGFPMMGDGSRIPAVLYRLQHPTCADEA
jgi:hypothetical protein